MAKNATNFAWDMDAEATVLKLIGLPTEPPTEQRSDLLTTIYERIIPQLVLSHWTEVRDQSQCPDTRLPPTREEVEEFAEISISQDLPRALAFVQTIVTQGVSLDVVLLHLISPAARRLGEDWEADLVSWSEVTIGLGTLQQVVRTLSPSFAPDLAHRGLVVLAAPPPEQHTLGLYLLAEFLRKDGWGVQVYPNLPSADLVDLVGSEHVEMVGLSVSNSEFFQPVARLVASIKRASVNQHVAVMIGGAIDLVAFAAEIEAQLFADPRDAVRWLDQYVNDGLCKQN